MWISVMTFCIPALSPTSRTYSKPWGEWRERKRQDSRREIIELWRRQKGLPVSVEAEQMPITAHVIMCRAENRAGLREKCSAGMHVYRALPSPQVNWDGCIMICNFSLHQNRFVIDKKHWQTFNNRTKIKLCTNKWLIYSFNCLTALIQNLCSVTNPKALFMSHPL